MNLRWLKAGGRGWFVALALGALALLLALAGGDGGQTGASQDEKRIAEVLGAIAGAGKVEIALYYEPAQSGAFGESAEKKPTGAVAVAQGANDVRVRLELIRALRTLLGLPETAVDVFVMEDER